MGAPIGSLVVKVGSDVKGLVIGFEKGRKEAKTFSSSVKKAAKALTGLGIAAGVAGVALAAKFTKDGLDSIDMMTKLGRTVGATQAEMVALTRTFERVGLTQAEVQSTLQRFTKRLGEAATGSGAAAQTLYDLGLSARELINLPLPDALGIVGERIQEIGSAAEKSAVAADIFGRRGLALVLATDDLAGQIAISTDEVQKFGVAIDQVDAQSIEDAQDAMSGLGLILDGVANQMAVVFAPAIVEISERIADSSAATGGFRVLILDTFRAGTQAILLFRDAIRAIDIGIASAKLAFLEAKKSFTGNLIDIDSLRFQRMEIRALADEINEMIDAPKAKDDVDTFFKAIEERIAEAKAKIVGDGRDVGDPLGILDETSQEARLDAIDSFNERRLQRENDVQKELTGIEQRWAEQRRRFDEQHLSQKVASVTSAFASVTAIVADQNKEMFEVNKGFQIADAIVNGIAGAIRTWNSVPYPWNIPLTVAHVAGTAAQIANLSSQQFQGGNSGGGGAAAATSVPSAAASGAGVGGGGGGGGGTAVNISLTGDTFGRAQVRDLIENINEAVDDGARLRIR